MMGPDEFGIGKSYEDAMRGSANEILSQKNRATCCEKKGMVPKNRPGPVRENKGRNRVPCRVGPTIKGVARHSEMPSKKRR